MTQAYARCSRLLAAGVFFWCAGTVIANDAAASRSQEIAKAAEALRPSLVATRRDIHQHPELGNREERTSRLVADRLRALGFDEVRTNVAHTGVVGLLKGTRPGPCVAIRADLDALPINETLDVPYKSLVAGVKHACGHDAHTTAALGAAEVLSKMRDQIQGSVKFLFQPAEEGVPAGEEGGAPLMIKEGALANPKPAAIYGLHTSVEVPVGQVGWRSGPAQASTVIFTITLRGKMGHAAMPQRGIDTVVVAAECISALQTIKSRRMDTFEPIILTIGTIHGGTRPNIIPEEIKLEGTVRSFTDETRNQVEKLMRETLAGVTSAYGATYEMDYKAITLVVYNNPKLVDESLPSVWQAVGKTNTVEVPQRMGGEDFSYYAREVPGFFLRLGSGNAANGITAEAHTADFDIDEDCLVVGTKTLCNLALEFLDRHAHED